MIITTEMREIINYLKGLDHYAIFAGFAGYLISGVDASNDIDIFVSSQKQVDQIVSEFKGWRETRRKHPGDTLFVSLQKENTSFDIYYSTRAAELYIPRRIKASFEDIKLFTVSYEVLLLTKLNQVASEKRTEIKSQRDRKVIRKLRERIDVGHINELLQHMGEDFWREGRL